MKGICLSKDPGSKDGFTSLQAGSDMVGHCCRQMGRRLIDARRKCCLGLLIYQHSSSKPSTRKPLTMRDVVDGAVIATHIVPTRSIGSQAVSGKELRCGCTRARGDCASVGRRRHRAKVGLRLRGIEAPGEIERGDIQTLGSVGDSGVRGGRGLSDFMLDDGVGITFTGAFLRPTMVRGKTLHRARLPVIGHSSRVMVAQWTGESQRVVNRPIRSSWLLRSVEQRFDIRRHRHRSLSPLHQVLTLAFCDMSVLFVRPRQSKRLTGILAGTAGQEFRVEVEERIGKGIHTFLRV